MEEAISSRVEATAAAAASRMKQLQGDNERLRKQAASQTSEMSRLVNTRSELERKNEVLRDRVHSLEDLKSSIESQSAQLQLKLDMGAYYIVLSACARCGFDR